MNLSIYIPTLKRLDHQTTWDHLPKAAQQHTLLVCPPEEAEGHKARGRNVLVCSAKGIAPTRDAIMQHALTTRSTKFVMLDDDIISQKRRPDGRITDCTPAEVMEAFAWLEENLNSVVHCGWATRFLGFADPKDVAEPSRMMHCLAYNAAELKKQGAGFAKNMPHPEQFAIDDVNMTIQLLLAGLPNRVSLVWRLRTHGSNAKGGASTWRTAAQQTANSKQLVAAYPQVVKLRPKKAWKGMETEEMFDVSVGWQKALKIGKGLL